jgi:TRAP transporter TAXI family solute receptor
MKSIHVTALAAVLSGTMGIAGATAQTYGFGTSAAGAWTHSAGSAIAKVMQEKAGIKALIQPQGTEPLPNVSADILQFCISNASDLSFTATATGYHEGDQKRPTLRAAAILTPLLGALFVRKDSNIHAITDLKGKRVPAEFGAQKSIKQSVTAHLANAGLTWNDVQPVPAPTVPRSADDFAAGKTDMFYFALGSAKVMQVGAAVGGLRVVPLMDTPEAVARLQAVLPGSYLLTAQPGKNMEGLEKPTKVVAQDMVLVTNDKVPEDVVYKAVKALHASKPDLVATFVGLGGFDPARMSIAVKGVPHHPGAIKFYKEIGAGPRS